MGRGQLKRIDEIFSETWALYTSRVIPIALVSLLSLLVSSILLIGGGAVAFDALGGQPFFSGDPQEVLLNPTVIGTGVLLFLLAVLLTSWCHTAVLTMTVQQEAGVLRGLITSWRYAFSLLWVSSLYVGIITAGSLFFILPGLMLALSMSLCFFIMVEEERAGIDALLASRLYIRGHWWNTLLKFLLILALSTLIALIPFPAGPILLLFFTPFLLLYMVTVYHDLKECADEDLASSFGFGWLWVLFGVFGFFLPLLTIIGSIIAFGPQLPDIIKQAQTELNQTLGTDLFPRKQADSDQFTDIKKEEIPLVRQLPSVDGFLIWRDPIGDTNHHLFDIKEVSVKGEQGELILMFTMTRSLSASFLAVKDRDFARLISFYLDTDTNRATGSTPFGQEPERIGYDLDIQVNLIARQEEKKKNTSGKIEVTVYQFDGSERRSVETPNKKTATVSGNTVTVRLPYYQLDVTPGDTIRICYQEAAEEQGRDLAKDKLVPLN
ncbi:MAG: hypothetical protein D3909_00815 [Candidatus Electrothrix sp. ATG1]|nr:hypothetical protein [Candidatus Electrothrix sp. ATG1]